MEQITTIGLDLAKNVFQVHAINAEGVAVVRRRLQRPGVLKYFASLAPCLIGMEACGTSHFWARELSAFGHEVRIMPPSYVKPYVRRGKNDAADAEAICEAVRRPNMRFVPVKTEDQQAALMLHKARELLVCQQIMLVNALRAHMAELGIIAAQGRGKIEDIIAVIDDVEDESVPALAKTALKPLAAQLRASEEAVATLDAEIKAWHKNSESSQRLATIPGVGVLTASVIAASVPDASFFRSGREFAAWLGLAPKQNSSGGKERLGRISKQGNPYIRRLLVIGATSMLRHARAKSAPGAEVGEQPARTKARTSRYGGHGQQNGPHRLGAAGKERDLSSLCRGSLSGHENNAARGGCPKICKGAHDLMPTGRNRGSGHLVRSHAATRPRFFDRDPIRELHQGQRPSAARTGRTHDRTRPWRLSSQIILAMQGPSTQGSSTFHVDFLNRHPGQG